MNIRWDYFVNQYDTARYVSSDGARDNRHIQFVREFASVVSILQVGICKCCVIPILTDDCTLGQDKQRHRPVQGHPTLRGRAVDVPLHIRSVP